MLDDLPTDKIRLEEALRSTYHAWEYHGSAPATLIEALEERFPTTSRSEWGYILASWGGVFVNGRPAHHDAPLPVPCRIEVYEPKFDRSRAEEVFPAFRSEFVIYHDDDAAVVFKPNRLPSMPAREQKLFSMKAYLDKHFGRTVHMPSRLDVSVEGLVAVSLSERMHIHLQQAFEHRRVDKEYRLLVKGSPAWSGMTMLAKIGRSTIHPAIRSIDDDGESARTELTVLHRGEYSLMQAKPFTGRTHQIRVHSAYAGFPILGDNFYGGDRAAQLHLLSYRVRFFHPFLNDFVEVTLPGELCPEWYHTLQYKESVERDLPPHKEL